MTRFTSYRREKGHVRNKTACSINIRSIERNAKVPCEYDYINQVEDLNLTSYKEKAQNRVICEYDDG